MPEKAVIMLFRKGRDEFFPSFMVSNTALLLTLNPLRIRLLYNEP
jgi:hypothetical protein